MRPNFQGMLVQQIGKALLCSEVKGMVRWLSSEASGSIYSHQVFLKHVRDLIWVPRCFPTMDILFTWSSISAIPRCHSETIHSTLYSSSASISLGGGFEKFRPCVSVSL